MLKEPVLSLCLPTNGIIEWVFPVLDSIYSQNVNENMFEVVVTNNGENEQFDRMMQEYAIKHVNLVYKKTNVYMFYNQLEALKIASGQYLKFINHRAILLDGTINRIINVIKENVSEKPVLFFSNGVMNRDSDVHTFDEFVRELGGYASWTTGVGIWRDDYENLPRELKIDRISPHSCILFAYRNKMKYKILNFKFCDEIEKGHLKKGTYDLFKAFAIEEFSIAQNLYIEGDITINTLKKVKKDYRRLVAGFYWTFCIRKKPCSYNLKGFEDAMGIYFNKYDVIVQAYLLGVKKVFAKIGGRRNDTL